MRYLCIDTSGSRTSVGAVNGNKRAYLSDDGFVKASRALMPMIDSALNQVELNIADADFVSVVIGPGSFTGIRIGVSAARALAYALNKPVVSVNSCELAAYNSRKAKDKKVLTALDAGNGFVFSALYDGEKEIEAPRCLTLAEFETFRQAAGECEIAADAKMSEILSVPQTGGDGIIDLSEIKFERGETLPFQKADAMYVRLSQAERTAAWK